MSDLEVTGVYGQNTRGVVSAADFRSPEPCSSLSSLAGASTTIPVTRLSLGMPWPTVCSEWCSDLDPHKQSRKAP